ncbi:type II secretion system F family protein [Candidatus Woesearchaeota archaeon]|nr:type II secretion system F family protein [Candidatus Woesearchaeota archaeon]
MAVSDSFFKEAKPAEKVRFSFADFMRRRTETRRLRKLGLKERLGKAGLDISTAKAGKIVLVACILINLALTFYALRRFSDYWAGNTVFLLVLILFIWVFLFVIVFFVTWFAFYMSLDVLVYRRKQKLEEVLPDFLQLVSSNIRAGMTIDQSLWFAIRPRFGVLAKEIEEVAKRTFAGEPLDVALQHFVDKFESKVLERSINILVEGMRAGGELGDLLNKISSNIQETNLLKKEMAANVTTYVIFITFATVFAAPFLFGMAYQLITVIQEVFSRVDISPGAVSGFPINISQGSLDIRDFQTFAVVSLMITSFFSAIIISAIKKGNVKGGLKYIPAFMISSVVLFFLVVRLFSMFVKGFF